MHEEYERRDISVEVALIKAQLNHLATDFFEHKTKEEIWQQTITSKLDANTSAMTKYTGTMGGIMLTITAIWAFVGVFKDWIWSRS